MHRRYARPVAAEEYFRAGVGMVVTRGGLVLGLERADRRGSWQVPQGGLQPGEPVLVGAQRELHEETNISWSDIAVIDEYPDWLAYELPTDARSTKTGRGQVHRWFLLRFHRTDDNIRLPPADGTAEFVAWQWMRLDDLVEAVWEPKRSVYQRWANRWRHLIE